MRISTAIIVEREVRSTSELGEQTFCELRTASFSRETAPFQGGEILSRRTALSRIVLTLFPLLVAACGSPSSTNLPSSLYPALILSKAERRQEVALKAARVLALLKQEMLSGILIASAPNFAWATAGAEGKVPLFLRDDGRKFFIAHTDDAPKALLEDLSDLGYEAKTTSWYSGGIGQKEMAAVLEQLTGGRPFGADIPCTGARTVDDAVAALQVPLTDGEVREYRWLGKTTAEQVETVCRQIRPWMTDRGIEVLLSDALLRHAIRAVQVEVEVDARIPGDGGKPRSDVSKVERHAAVTICGERWGLKVAMTRIVHFGPLEKDAQAHLKAAARVNAGFWARTLPGAAAGSILQGAIADYAEAGYSQEWSKHGPGGAIGYRDRDWPAAPDSAHAVRCPQAFAWKATVGDARIEDTILLIGDGMEVLTETPDWPRVGSKALGRIYRSPGILVQ